MYRHLNEMLSQAQRMSFVVNSRLVSAFTSISIPLTLVISTAQPRRPFAVRCSLTSAVKVSLVGTIATVSISDFFGRRRSVDSRSNISRRRTRPRTSRSLPAPADRSSPLNPFVRRSSSAIQFGIAPRSHPPRRSLTAANTFNPPSTHPPHSHSSSNDYAHAPH